MEKTIIKMINAYELIYVTIPSDSLENIYELMINNKMFQPNIGIEMFYIAIYWRFRLNITKMVEHYLMAIENGCSSAMNNLAVHHENNRNFENKNSLAMSNLACYYHDIGDFSNAVKYFLMAIENGNTDAMYYLAGHYEKLLDFENMTKYLLMSIENNNVRAMEELTKYYEKKYEFKHMIKYYSMALKYNSHTAYKYLTEYYLEHNIERVFDELFFDNLNFLAGDILLAIKNMYNFNTNVLYLHFKYLPNLVEGHCFGMLCGMFLLVAFGILMLCLKLSE